MTGMTLEQVLRVLAARWRVLAAVLAGTLVLALIAGLALPPKYSATATVVLESKPDPVASVMMSTGLAPALNLNAMAEAEIVTSERVARRVVTLLKLEQDEKIQADWRAATGGKGKLEVWLGALLLKKVSVKMTTMQSNVLPIKFDSSDPEFAAAVANAFAQAYIELCIQRKVEPAKQYADWFSTQEKTLRESLAQALTRLSRYQQQTGIVARDEQLDSETAKLNQLSQQLAQVLGLTADARSKEKTGEAAENLPEIAAHPVLTGLRTDLARNEAKLKELAVNLGRNHPQYKRTESENAAIRTQLEAETRYVMSGFTATRSVSTTREAELRAAIEAQKRTLLQMKSQREQLAALQREVDAAKKAHDGVVTQLQQSNLDSQATVANVTVLTPAVPPSEPSFPKLGLFLAVALPAGLLLGAASAYGLDLLDRRVRCPADIAEVLELPVLAVLERPRPAPPPTGWRSLRPRIAAALGR